MQNFDYYWWKADKNDAYKSLFAYVKYLNQNQTYRTNDNLVNMRLYGNLDILGLGSYNYMRTEPGYNTTNRLTLNIVQSMVDTVVSKISKNKPKPMFLTSGGDWSLQRKAQKLNKFVEGQFYANDFYSKTATAFQDACIFGTGGIKFYKEDGEIKTERCFIEEIVVDDTECFYAQPRQMMQRKYVHKDILSEKFPKYAGLIRQLDTQTFDQSMPRPNMTDMVLVVEAWHIPSGKDAGDGVHGIYIENATLFEEEYTKDYFPFVFFRWNQRPLGFFGQGLSEQLRGIQIELNKTLRTIQVSMHLVAIPKLFVEASSKVVTAHLNNKIGGIIKYQGTKPSYDQLSNVPPVLFQHVESLYNKAYELAGVSQLSAQSVKPGGLDSGKALREYNDLESERFMTVAQRYETAHMEACKLFIAMAKEIYEETGEYKVKVKGKKFLETIDWAEIDLNEDQYMMQVFPTSSLSSTPAGRLSDVQDLMSAGFISKEYAVKLLDFPDLEQYYNFYNAGIEDIERLIEIFVDKGEYQTPEPYQNLALGITTMQQAYLYYKTQSLPEEKLELFRRWISDANNLIDQAKNASLLAAEEAQQDTAAMTGQAIPAELGSPLAVSPSSLQIPMPEDIGTPKEAGIAAPSTMSPGTLAQ